MRTEDRQQFSGRNRSDRLQIRTIQHAGKSAAAPPTDRSGSDRSQSMPKAFPSPRQYISKSNYFKPIPDFPDSCRFLRQKGLIIFFREGDTALSSTRAKVTIDGNEAAAY